MKRILLVSALGAAGLGIAYAAGDAGGTDQGER